MKNVDYLSVFKLPKPTKITGRSSTIINSFVCSIIPIIQPTNDQVKQALNILGMDHDGFQCAYCGDTASEWGHLHPLIKTKKPTGYILEIGNLVPACGKCNLSKGNKSWASWIKSRAKLSPKSKGIPDLEQRIERLNNYEQWGKPTKINFEEVIGAEKWKQHWDNCVRIQIEMRNAQKLASEINDSVGEHVKLMK